MCFHAVWANYITYGRKRLQKVLDMNNGYPTFVDTQETLISSTSTNSESESEYHPGPSTPTEAIDTRRIYIYKPPTLNLNLLFNVFSPW